MSWLRGLIAALVCLSAGAAQATQTLGGLPRRATLGAAVADQAGGGVKVTAVVPDSPAARGGLAVGDVIRTIGSRPIAGAADFVAGVKAAPAPATMAFAIERADRPQVLQIPLATAAVETDPAVDTVYGAVSVGGSLRRTLRTTPHGDAARRPAVLIIGGIGCFSVDVATDRNDPYLRLAHDLARRGVVAMRVEKSGVGDSQGAPCLATDFKAETAGYLAAFDALQHDPRVDPSRIYLFGHSIGTLIAPAMALDHPVAGIVVAEAVGRNWFEYELLNLRRQLQLGGDPPDVVDAAIASKERCMHRLLIARDAEAAIEQDEPACKIHNVYPAPASYMQQVAAVNVAAPWTRISAPVLAIYGDADFVTDEADHRRIVAIVNASHPGAAALQVIAGMDHHLAQGGSPQADYNLRVVQHGAPPYEPKFGAAVTSWICAREACLS
jgi:pimeloyl-ACP methyl ester carboxylesterase